MGLRALNMKTHGVVMELQASGAACFCTPIIRDARAEPFDAGSVVETECGMHMTILHFAPLGTRDISASSLPFGICEFASQHTVLKSTWYTVQKQSEET